jgi:hypothetical protein
MIIKVELPKVFKRFLIVLTLSIITSCAPRETYDLVLMHSGSGHVDNVYVAFYGVKFNFAQISKVRNVTYSQVAHPIPKTISVTWESPSGEPHSQQVNVRKLIPRGFRGKIFIIFDDTQSITISGITDRDYNQGKRP